MTIREKLLKQLADVKVGKWATISIRERKVERRDGGLDLVPYVSIAVKRVAKSLYQLGTSSPWKSAEQVAEYLITMQEKTCQKS